MTEQRSVQDVVTDYVGRLAGRPVEADEAIISSRLLESIAAVQLIDFMQNVFGVEVDDEDLMLANFDSVDAIAALIRRKVGTA